MASAKAGSLKVAESGADRVRPEERDLRSGPEWHCKGAEPGLRLHSAEMGELLGSSVQDLTHTLAGLWGGGCPLNFLGPSHVILQPPAHSRSFLRGCVSSP